VSTPYSSDAAGAGAGWRVWLEAARPRTLPASVAPVIAGSAAGTVAAPGGLAWWRFLTAVVVALSVQVAVNYANDYFDGVGGVDTEARSGPRRAVAAGLVAPGQMLTAAVLATGVSAVAGLALALAVDPWLIVIGGCCFLAAFGYSGGPRPYASAGLGELFVFVFFGLVATVGSAYVQHQTIGWTAVACGFAIGMLAVALLVANNLRDIPTDTVAGKRTLPVRLGDRRTRQLYVSVVIGALVVAIVVLPLVAWSPALLLSLLAVPLAVGPLRRIRGGASGRDLIPVLAETGRLELAVGLLIAAGFALAQLIS
jgi:1,4-dihydroxy-2-naphthoate polyprenyltransferase